MQTVSFKLLDFRVDILPSFFVLLGIYALFEIAAGTPLDAIQWGVVLLVSILLHELGHGVAARRFGLRVGAIQLHMMGGHVTHEPTKPSRQLAISLAGPGAGLLLGLGTLAVAQVVPPTPFSASLVEDLVYVNIGWSLVNLLPLYPLDGGMGLQAALGVYWGERRAVRTTARVGVVLGVVLAVIGWQLNLMLVPLIAGAAAYQNWQRLQR
jgi:stage IV sporulation protein FB